MADTPTPSAATPTPSDLRRATAFRRFFLGMAIYAALVVVEGLLVRDAEPAVWLGVAMALAPVAAAVWAMVNWLDAIRTFDEFQQKLFAESGLIALGITAIATFTYGFLESYVGMPKLSMFLVFPFMALCYTLSLPVVRRRYL